MRIARLKEGGFQITGLYRSATGKEKEVTLLKRDKNTPLSKLAGITKADRERLDKEAGV